MKSSARVRRAVPETAVLVLAMLVVTTAAQETTTFKLNIQGISNRKGNEFSKCATAKGAVGKCVDWSYCNSDLEIEVGGVIDQSELRSLECLKNEWCCSDRNITIPAKPMSKETDTPNNCRVSNKPDCPWCVKLYRDGNDNRRLRSGFFCMGTLVSARVVLTTATCMVQAHKQNVWARVPSAANPNTNYTVQSRLIHPQYNSGTRENDLALFALDTELERDRGGARAACLALEPNALEGDCIAAGVDDGEYIDITPVTVTKGNCGRGADTDAACGRAVGGDCSVVPGSPVMCRPNKGPYTMTGLAKLPCVDDPPQALLNNLVHGARWLNDHLNRTMGVN